MGVRNRDTGMLPRDVGKRVWVKSYGFAMENEDQRDARKVREG